MRRARHAAEQADLRVHLVDASLLFDAATIPAPLFDDEILVYNKRDLLADRATFPGGIVISCRTGEGIDSLIQTIISKVTGHSKGEKGVHGETVQDGAAINARHQDCLKRASSSLVAAMDLLGAGDPPELVAVELRTALGAVGEVVGEAGTEEILGKIFSSFCIGK